jgi:hypothetical protein
LNEVPSVTPNAPPEEFAPVMKFVPVTVMALPPFAVPPIELSEVMVGVFGLLPKE